VWVAAGVPARRSEASTKLDGQGGHFAIQRQDRRASVGVIEGDESVGEAGFLGFAQRVEHRVAIGGLDQTAGQRRKDRRPGVGLAQGVVVLKHRIGLGDDDVGDREVLRLRRAQRRESRKQIRGVVRGL